MHRILAAAVLLAGLSTSMAHAATVRVTVADYTFSPATITIHPGDTVVWTNRDGTPHTVTALDKAFVSPTLDPGGSYSFVFARGGSFSYRCGIHPEMRGTIVVALDKQSS